MSRTGSALPPVSLPDAAKAIGVELEDFRREDRRERFKLTDAPRPDWCTDKRMKFFTPASVERARESHAATRELRRTNKALATKYLDKSVLPATRSDRGAKRLVIAGGLLQSKDQAEGCERSTIQVQPRGELPRRRTARHPRHARVESRKAQRAVSVQPSHLDSRRSVDEGVHLFRRWTPCRRGQGRQGAGTRMS